MLLSAVSLTVLAHLLVFKTSATAYPFFDLLSGPSDGLSTQRYGEIPRYRVPTVPQGEGQGWLARWLSMGGEGDVNLLVSQRILLRPR
jgi:hypothetical protein